jgi:HSP20 family molecular chaperone IbpA
MVRTMVLPTGTDGAAINATYKDGILEVVVPIPQAAKGTATTVPITRAD